jgi:Lrp/AsnC family transcriptional regulator for asnA, asnC and gidA
MSQIDKIDRDIVNLLMEDGRMPAAEIARRLGSISERVVRYRIERMINEGVISICAVPNPRAIGYDVVADIFIEVEPAYIDEVAAVLAQNGSVSYVACAIGAPDISVQVIARDNAEVYAFATQVIGKLPGVRKSTTSIVPIVKKDVYQWRIPEDAVDQRNVSKLPESQVPGR